MDITATQARQLDRSSEIALRRLLHSLEPFMRAYPIDQKAEMPDHDMKWVTGIGDESVGKAVAEIMKAYPALWLGALPDDVCIVPKSGLRQVVGSHPHVVEHLEQYGIARVDSEAARLRHEIEIERR